MRRISKGLRSQTASVVHMHQQQQNLATFAKAIRPAMHQYCAASRFLRQAYLSGTLRLLGQALHHEQGTYGAVPVLSSHHQAQWNPGGQLAPQAQPLAAPAADLALPQVQAGTVQSHHTAVHAVHLPAAPDACVAERAWQGGVSLASPGHDCCGRQQDPEPEPEMGTGVCEQGSDGRLQLWLVNVGADVARRDEGSAAGRSGAEGMQGLSAGVIGAVTCLATCASAHTAYQPVQTQHKLSFNSKTKTVHMTIVNHPVVLLKLRKHMGFCRT